MTITHEPVHRDIHKPIERERRPHPQPHTQQPRVDEFHPRHNIRIDTTFWQHRSIFAGSQEQLNQLRREADARAAERAAERARADITNYLNAQSQPTTLELHQPAIRRLKPIVHVGLVPMLWAITTCKCGHRWPCNDIKQHLRRRLGWTTDITDHLKNLTQHLPKPTTRWKRLRRWVTRRRAASHRPTLEDRDRCPANKRPALDDSNSRVGGMRSMLAKEGGRRAKRGDDLADGLAMLCPRRDGARRSWS